MFKELGPKQYHTSLKFCFYTLVEFSREMIFYMIDPCKIILYLDSILPTSKTEKNSVIGL